LRIQAFSKSERFTLVADLKRSLTRMLELIIRANKSRNKFQAQVYQQQKLLMKKLLIF